MTLHEDTLVRQGQIIDAARRLIIRFGSEHITVGRIAREVGISEAAIYRHFRSKKDIISLLIDHIQEGLEQDMTRASAEGSTPLDILDKTLRNHLSSFKQAQGVSFLVIAEIVSLGDVKLNRKISLIVEKYTGYIERLLSEAIEKGQVRVDVNLRAASTLAFGMIHGLVNRWALNKNSVNLEEEYPPLWEVFKASVIKRPA